MNTRIRPRPTAAVPFPVPVRGVVRYIDTIKVWLPRRLSEAETYALIEACAPGTMPHNATWSFRGWTLRQRWILQQPSPDALELLQGLFGDRVHLNRVHLALDFLVHSVDDAWRLNWWFDEVQVRPFRGMPHFVRPRGFNTTYYAPLEAPWNIVRYPDKPSKLTGDPCLHVEARLQGARAPQAEGVGSLSALLALDHEAFWHQWLLLLQADLVQLGFVLIGMKRRGRPPKAETLLRQYAARIGAHHVWEHDLWGTPSAQVCLDRGRLRGIAVRRAYRRLPLKLRER